MVAYGFQLPLFPSQERGVAVPSVRVHLCRCHAVWRHARAALSLTAQHNKLLADRHRVLAPDYRLGQKVWLYTKDLPLPVDSRKLAPRFNRPFEIEKIINLSAIRLKLPASSTYTLPIFHVSLLKPVTTSALSVVCLRHFVTLLINFYF